MVLTTSGTTGVVETTLRALLATGAVSEQRSTLHESRRPRCAGTTNSH